MHWNLFFVQPAIRALCSQTGKPYLCPIRWHDTKVLLSNASRISSRAGIIAQLGNHRPTRSLDTCCGLQIDMSSKPDGVHPRNEKYILRKAFDDATKPYLPEDVLWRQKEQFSDGVGYDWVDGLRDYAYKVRYCDTPFRVVGGRHSGVPNWNRILCQRRSQCPIVHAKLCPMHVLSEWCLW
jgi:Asparagine synthase